MNENNRIIKPSADEIAAQKKMQHTATLSLSIILGQMAQELKSVDSDDKPVEFAMTLRRIPDPKHDPGLMIAAKKIFFFRAEAMWVQKVNGQEQSFHAHGPAFSAEDLNKGVNITAVFRKIVEGIRSKQAEIEEQGGIAP